MASTPTSTTPVDTADGSVVQRLDYDAYGNVSLDTNPGFQPFGFVGGIRDPDTGLVRFAHRDYDPLAGRWTTPDPSGFGGGSVNLYTYGAGDPVQFVDPSGDFIIIAAVAIVAAATGITAYVYSRQVQDTALNVGVRAGPVDTSCSMRDGCRLGVASVQPGGEIRRQEI